MQLERKYRPWARFQYFLRIAFPNLYFGDGAVVLSSLHLHTDCLSLGGAWSVCGSPSVIHPAPSQGRLNCQLLSSIKSTWIRAIRGNWTCCFLVYFSAVSVGVYSCHLYYPCKWDCHYGGKTTVITRIMKQAKQAYINSEYLEKYVKKERISLKLFLYLEEE